MAIDINPVITAIEYYLPAQMLTNERLCEAFPDNTPQKIVAKTGIQCRRVAADDELASDLAVAAASKMLASRSSVADDIDFLLLVTQSPDYLLPTTACLVHERLGLRSSAGALDINLGCSGFVYAVALAKSMVAAGVARNVCLVTCETYSKFTSEANFGVRAIFGDGATATMIERATTPSPLGHDWLGPFVFGTDGKGAENLILRRGGVQALVAQAKRPPATDPCDDKDLLYMNGPEIFTFTLRVVPECAARLLAQAQLSMDDIDLFVFHQANEFMLEHLRKKLAIPKEKFVLAFSDCGNTTSSSIPLALKRHVGERNLPAGATIMLMGFGVGYSWAGGIMRWFPLDGRD